MMLHLPASLLALTFLHAFTYALPVTTNACSPSHLTLVLGASYSTSSIVGTYCSDLLLSTPNPPTAPAPPTTLSYSESDIRAACDCVLASFASSQPLPPISAQSPQILPSQPPSQPPPLSPPPLVGAAEVAMQGLNSGLSAKEQELRIRAGEVWQPYGRGAVPVPVGSELKGFGARDNLYIRGGVVDGFRNRLE